MPGVAHRGRGRRTINEINMVPFIDVMLVLLIIFMVTAPLITPSVVALPSVSRAAPSPTQVIEVIVNKDETLRLRIRDDTRTVRLDELAANVLSAQGQVQGTESGNSAVVISADKNVKYEAVVKVMDTLQRAGVQRVGLSVQTAR
ncbi:biopolymer transporter ExbD [Hylemonella gracilis str. Niagara R]|uniref:Biopolymer transporter ExbD n=1 Tax=Hylemonella gracilis str. Niagara R TaxID=1458275 RepID=A0A016XG44_9BURK|nr:ExbD/TolR family protein [Hylemonella gracilis]EYC50890.1 biopolymer transporter ExbD [Hylemonella gracilis str. Niagara R]